MKNCKDCKHAEWKLTTAGKLHPSGDGRCKYPYKVPQLPGCMYWIGAEPSPCGGHISRKEDMGKHCPYWAQTSCCLTTEFRRGEAVALQC